MQSLACILIALSACKALKPSPSGELEITDPNRICVMIKNNYGRYLTSLLTQQVF